ncbi:hypothetical protein ANCCEY_11977 [Ancylostoma ceylanicum]|uniref:Ionotropic glutamate receptor C-terminal domain-containing protein n=1 Tax=Ancylostoma ceylanicum TaxID=53326 RepID=A0A0D6LCG6_9BILA|nr:hypothetical protein ANCCEY_11977 [Ancylostoma ceylanicum]
MGGDLRGCGYMITMPYATKEKSSLPLNQRESLENKTLKVSVYLKIARLTKFNYTIHEVKDKAYGIREENGKWNGMVGELINGKPQTAEADWFMFLWPLSWEVWLFSFASYMVTSIALWLIAKISPFEKVVHNNETGNWDKVDNQFSFRNAFWFTVCSLMQQGSELSPRAPSTRVATAVWWFFAMILISSYTANLAAFLTTQRMLTPIENADDLSSQTKIKYGTLGRGSTMSFFNESKIETYERMWKLMSSNPSLFVDSSKEGIARVKCYKKTNLEQIDAVSFIFIISREFMTQQEAPVAARSSMLRISCESISYIHHSEEMLTLVRFHLVRTSEDRVGGQTSGSPYREEISRAILRLQEKTVLTELKEKWWKDKSVVCEPVVKKGTDDGGSIGGIFVILVIGLGVTVIFVGLEMLSRPDVDAEGKPPRGTWYQLKHALCFIRSSNHRLKRKIDNLIVYEDGRPTYQLQGLRLHEDMRLANAKFFRRT